MQTPCSARNSARSSWPGSLRIVRLQRSITVVPRERAWRTNARKPGCNSGAPPVRSRQEIPWRSRICGINARRSAAIISVRVGPALTWQWAQLWLQRYPRLTCNVVSCPRFSGGKTLSTTLTGTQQTMLILPDRSSEWSGFLSTKSTGLLLISCVNRRWRAFHCGATGFRT